MIDIQLDDDEANVLDAYRASLRAIRPQLVGAIAEDADRVLAQSDGGAHMNAAAKRTMPVGLCTRVLAR